ncbi:MAG: sigma-70 family RNA polymerase sigma factor [Fuerstiella sp.]
MVASASETKARSYSMGDVGTRRYPEIRSGMTVRQRREAMADLAEVMPGAIWNKEFEAAGAEKKILPLPAELDSTPPRRRVSGGIDLAKYFGTTARLPLLTPDQEVFYFRRMNFLCWRAEQTLESLNPARPSLRGLRKIVSDLEAADRDRNLLAEHNLRLVIPLAHRLHLKSESVWDYISEGNAALLRAIRGFDYGRGFRFSTYATWAIVNSLQRLASRQHRDSVRFMPTEFTVFNHVEGSHESVTEQVQRTKIARETVAELLNVLDERSQRVVSMRYGLKPHDEPLTLKEVGEHLGVSKERIRQIEKTALRKMGIAVGGESMLPA